MMADFAQQLLTSHPPEAALAFAPLVTLFSEVFDEAATTGSLRPGLRRSTIAGMVLEAVMFNAFSATIAGTSIRPEGEDAAEELWDLILHGVGAERSPPNSFPEGRIGFSVARTVGCRCRRRLATWMDQGGL